MEASYELNKSTDGQFYFVLKDGNAENILTSERYQAVASARNGIESVQTNCIADGRYDRKQSENGKYFFNLTAANHQVIGTSRMYASVELRDGAIASAKANGITRKVKENI